MLIGERLREFRESKSLSQGGIEKRTGLLRCYTSRVENGHTVPNIETLEKYARALEVPMYALFYEGQGKLLPPEQAKRGRGSKKTARELQLFVQLLARMKGRDRVLLLGMAQRMASRKKTT
jgi:transcriptional regulator with XRE-family HTH domain